MSSPIDFGLTFIDEIDGAIQEGRGAAAEVLGQTYDVRRLDDKTNGSISNNQPIFKNFPARLRRTTQKVAIENEIFSLLCFVALCDNSKIELMDQFREVGYGAMDQGIYVLAQKRPTRETLWMRAEWNCAITRPHPDGGRSDQQPTTGWSSIDGYGGIPKAHEEVLTLTNGLYAFSNDTALSPASVSCALQPLNRIRDGSSLGTPTDFYREHFLVFVPDLPGEQLNELDRINFPNSDRYEIAVIYTSDLTGLAGNILVVEKLGV